MSLNGLSDNIPFELMKSMLALLRFRDASFLFTQHFMRELLSAVHRMLASFPLVRTND